MALLPIVKKIIKEENSKKKLQELVDNLDEFIHSENQKKHFSGVEANELPSQFVV